MAASPGLFESLRRLLGTTVELAQLRVELLASDLELEKLRLVGAALRALVGLLLLGIGLLLAVGFVLLIVEPGRRMAALGLMAAGFVFVGAWLLRAARLHLQQGGPMFAATAAELKRDRDAFGASD